MPTHEPPASASSVPGLQLAFRLSSLDPEIWEGEKMKEDKEPEFRDQLPPPTAQMYMAVQSHINWQLTGGHRAGQPMPTEEKTKRVNSHHV